MKKVVIANDHGAVDLVKRLISHLESKGYEINWVGTKTTDSVDYPEFAEKACKEYLNGGYEFGIVCCGTGIGISIAANKIKGIRCALPQNEFAATMAKEHNNANFIAFGGRIDYPVDPVVMLDAFIKTEVSSDERHMRRREKLAALESRY